MKQGSKSRRLESIIELGKGSGTLDAHIVQGDEILLSPGLAGEDTVDCPSGEVLIGGGFESDHGQMVVVNQNKRNGPDMGFGEKLWTNL